jgi:hypothetical protein
MSNNVNAEGKRFSPAKRFAGFALIALVALTGFIIGILIIRYALSSPGEEQSLPVPHSLFIALTSFTLGGFFLVLGILLYSLVITTRCFTFNFRKPFWNTLRTRLSITNIFLLFFFDIGVGFMLSVFITPLLMALGLPFAIALAIPILGAVLCIGLLTSFLSIWTPLDKPMITQRLLLLGVPQEDIERGILIGISDPAKSSFKKFTMVEEDVGMLWLNPESLVYHGDSKSFEIMKNELLDIERSSDPGSLAAYGGAVDIILHFRQDSGAESLIRLHTEGNWTLRAMRRSLDSLAQKLAAWHRGEGAASETENGS